MSEPFPSVAPQIPVSDIARTAPYYEKCPGFRWNWGMEGIGQVSRGGCRLFLTDGAFRKERSRGTAAPVVNWTNLNSKAEVDGLHEAWSNSSARIVSAPESMPWNLLELADLDGSLFRVFYDFAWELPDRGGRVDDAAEREAARARA